MDWRILSIEGCWCREGLSDIGTLYAFGTQDSRTAASVCKIEPHYWIVCNDKTICRSHWENREEAFTGVYEIQMQSNKLIPRKLCISHVKKGDVPGKNASFKKSRYQKELGRVSLCLVFGCFCKHVERQIEAGWGFFQGQFHEANAVFYSSDWFFLTRSWPHGIISRLTSKSYDHIKSTESKGNFHQREMFLPSVTALWLHGSCHAGSSFPSLMLEFPLKPNLSFTCNRFKVPAVGHCFSGTAEQKTKNWPSPFSHKGHESDRNHSIRWWKKGPNNSLGGWHWSRY